ncbi:hypothetical protein [Leptospira kirschneri]|uniref:hypothetical protein n=1 Tax=Leptospira kirschneri TaxID=29507 RepID=UPI0003069C88|nr:hypothetical protein [Leptospira kirschneri]
MSFVKPDVLPRRDRSNKGRSGKKRLEFATNHKKRAGRNTGSNFIESERMS